MFVGMCFLGSNYAPATLNGGGGANSLNSPKTDDNSDLNKVENGDDYVVTLKTYDEYFTDLDIKADTITEQDLTGSGSATDPYIVHSTRGFLYLTNYDLSKISFNNKFVELACDVVLNEESFDKDGNPSGGDGKVYEWQNFNNGGITLHGNGHKIKGMYMIAIGGYTGLFNYPASAKLVDGIDFVGFYCRGSYASSVGYIVRTASNIVVRDSYFFGTSNAASIGVQGEIYNCVNYSYVNAVTNASGIVGSVIYSAKNCKNYGEIQGEKHVAGITAMVESQSTIIENCENYGDIHGSTNVGGIVGYTMFECYVVFENCSNYGNILSGAYKGGIIAFFGGKLELINCLNGGFIVTNTTTSGQLIGCVTSRGVVTHSKVKVSRCETLPTNSASIIASFYIDSNDKKLDMNISNCKFDFSKATDKKVYVISNVDSRIFAEIKNVYVLLSANSKDFYVVDQITNTQQAKMKNILVEDEALQRTKFVICSNVPNGELFVEGIILLGENTYAGSDFTGFYIDFKSGRIGLKAFSGNGFYQGKVTEEVLRSKGFVKQEI